MIVLKLLLYSDLNAHERNATSIEDKQYSPAPSHSNKSEGDSTVKAYRKSVGPKVIKTITVAY